MKRNILKKGITEDKIRLIPNWIDFNTTNPIPREENPLFDVFGISREKFVVLYAGNFGAAQGAEIVLEVADRMKDISSIQFVILGGGSGFADAVKKARTLPNVFISPLLPQKRVSEVYSMGDVALITCKEGVGNSGMPSKTWSIMACNTPIIASFDQESELAAVLKESKAGICIKPQDVEQLSCAIMNYYRSNSEGPGLKNKDPREYCLTSISKQESVKKYIICMQEGIE